LPAGTKLFFSVASARQANPKSDVFRQTDTDDTAPQMDCGPAASGKLEEPQCEIASMGEVPFKYPQMTNEEKLWF
jgi:hypothetical protein